MDSRWSKGLGVGCKCCNAAGIDTVFGTYNICSAFSMESRHFKTHAATTIHRLASAAFLGGMAYKALHCPQVGLLPDPEAIFQRLKEQLRKDMCKAVSRLCNTEYANAVGVEVEAAKVEAKNSDTPELVVPRWRQARKTSR